MFAPNVTPPSVDRATKTSVLTWVGSFRVSWKSCHATCTSPTGTTKGSAPIPCRIPANTGAENLTPWSDDELTWTPNGPPAASQATYTRLTNELPGFVSTVIIGLSLNMEAPVCKSKKVAVHVWPPSEERATAISVPTTPAKPLLKKTTMYEQSTLPRVAHAPPGSD